MRPSAHPHFSNFYVQILRIVVHQTLPVVRMSALQEVSNAGKCHTMRIFVEFVLELPTYPQNLLGTYIFIILRPHLPTYLVGHRVVRRVCTDIYVGFQPSFFHVSVGLPKKWGLPPKFGQIEITTFCT